MKYWISLLIFSLLSTCSFAQTKKILLIGMDGCRADALTVAHTPVLDQVMTEGYACLDARTVVPTMSGPGWASMLTGVWYNKHQVNGNLFIGTKLDDYVHLFNHIEAQNSDLFTASISHWAPINNKIIRKVDYKSSPKTDEAVAAEAVQLFQEKNPDAVFLHFDDIDHAGHFSGFSPNNKKYIHEIEKVDSLIGLVLTALKARPNFKEEDWLILFSPDHGGINNSHGGGTTVERKTFLIAHNKKIAPQSPNPFLVSCYPTHILPFSKATQQMVLSPLPTPTQKNWTFSLSFRIKTWKSDAFLVNSPNLILKTHPKNEYGWILWLDDKKIKIEGDSIHDQKWHNIQVSCTENGLVTVLQNGRIIGLEQCNDPMKNILQDSLVLHYNKDKKGASLVWDMYDVMLFPFIQENPHRLHWIGDHPNNKNTPATVYSWQNKKLQKYVRTKTPKQGIKGPIYFKDYSHFPTMVDITPTLLNHLGIDISQEQKSTYFDGKPLIYDEDESLGKKYRLD